MKIFVDENIPSMTVRELRAMGHNVTDIRGTPNQGISDEELWLMVKRENMKDSIQSTWKSRKKK